MCFKFQSERECPDPFSHGLLWGKGKWPSFQLARHIYVGDILYGGQFPHHVRFPSLYSLAFQYADLTQNEARYTGKIPSQPDREAIGRYTSDVLSAQAKPLDFVYYVPDGYDTVNGSKVPNVEATAEPTLILTAHFAGGYETWPSKRAMVR